MFLDDRQNFRVSSLLVWILLLVGFKALPSAQDFQRVTTDQIISEVDIAVFKWVRPHPAGRAFKGLRFHLKAQPARFSPQDAGAPT